MLEDPEQMVRTPLLPDYVILLSGQDDPLKAPKDIAAFLRQHHGTSFIDARRVPAYEWNWRGAIDHFPGRPSVGTYAFGGSG